MLAQVADMITIMYDSLGKSSCGCGLDFKDWIFWYKGNRLEYSCSIVLRVCGVIFRYFKD
jgi:hypothetical protein